MHQSDAAQVGSDSGFLLMGAGPQMFQGGLSKDKQALEQPRVGKADFQMN